MSEIADATRSPTAARLRPVPRASQRARHAIRRPDTVASRDDLDALREAIAWRRNQHSRGALEGVGSVLALRHLTALDDLLFETTAVESEALVTIDREQAVSLCEIAGAYVAERDVEGFQSAEERVRIARLRTLSGPLMDTCCELAAAEREACQKELLSSP